MKTISIPANELDTLTLIADDLRTIAENSRTADKELLALALHKVSDDLTGWSEWANLKALKQDDDFARFDEACATPPAPISQSCCICGKPLEATERHNAHPVYEYGVCCNECNDEFVIPARIARHEQERAEK